jgi:tetratricopeptide (TPR) repeat protein
MLNLADSLLLMGRTRQELGRTQDAIQLFTRLSKLRELLPALAAETHARLGELHLDRKKYQRARRHLQIALLHDPDNAHSHHLLANAYRHQGEDQWAVAAEHFQKALALDAGNVECLVDFGLLRVRQGHTEDGLTHLRRALEWKPDDPALLSRVMKVMRLAGRNDEARKAVRAAMFRNSRDARFRLVWDRYQFQRLRREQQRNRTVAAPEAENPAILAFVPRPRQASVAGDRPLSCGRVSRARVWHLRPFVGEAGA